MEVAIGLYSLAVPLLFGWLGRLFVAASHLVGESPWAMIGLSVATAVFALAPPTLLMGGTLPVLTRFAAVGAAQPGRTAGLLYAVNTAGAVLGCFLAGVLLVFRLGVVETNLVAAAIDLAVGAMALAFDGRAVATPDGRRPAGSMAAPAPGRVALLVASVSGFLGLAYEILWFRGLLAAITDDTTYAFTLMLTTFLAGHAFGAAVAGRLSGDQRIDCDWRRLGEAQILSALTALLSLPFLVVVRRPINLTSFVEGMSFWGGRIPLHLAISLAVVGPSAVCQGASFTLAARLYVGRGQPVGTGAGRLYGLNTLGAVLGAVATTAWLIPALGTQQSTILLAVSQAVLGAVAMLGYGGRRGDRLGRAYVTTAWALVVALGCGLNYLFPLRRIYAEQEPGNLLTLVEGAGAAVTVHQRKAGDRVISINGVNVAGTNQVLRATQKLQAHLPVCLHRSPRSVLQIGFGSGGTCYSVSLHSEVDSIEVVELNPDIPKVAASWFGDINRGVLNDPRVRVRIVDAKSYVAATGRSYDLILSDSTHPRFRGNASLYSHDYFAHCARRLRPGGILSTWLPLYGMSVDDIRGILKSLQATFPHVQVWYANPEPHENTLVIASRSPITIDTACLARRLAEEPVARDLAEVGITSLTQLLDFFMLGDRAVADFSRAGRLNTDDHPRLEYLAPRTLTRKRSWAENFAALRPAREPIHPYLVGADPSENARLARWYAGTTWKLAGQSHELENRLAEALKAYSECVRLNPEDLLAGVRYERLRRAVESSGTTQSNLTGSSNDDH
jgi:spermidine synthase